MDIRLAEPKDSEDIQDFIKSHWKDDHIFVKDNNFFNYEMCLFGAPNFVLAFNGGKLIGILGFTCNRDSIKTSDLFLVMFRVIKSQASIKVGINLINHLSSLTKYKIHTIGANEKTLTYYNFLGFNTGWLDHFYWLNDDPKLSFLFIKKSSNIKNFQQKNTDELFQIFESDLSKYKFNSISECGHNLPKSRSFFVRRYFRHPHYKYVFLSNIMLNGFGVVREVDVKGFKGWRIIDWYGHLNKFSDFCSALIVRAKERNISFIDLYVKGINEDDLITAGLNRISESVVIPNYLEPLVMKNISISYASSLDENIFLIRGDGDQDRPSY